MRIGVDLRSLAGERYSGVEEYVRQLLTAMITAPAAHEFILYFNAFRGSTPLTHLAKQYPERVSLRRTRWPNKVLNSGMIVAGQPHLTRFTGPVDLFFSPNWLFTALPTTVPHVITYHDLSHELYPEFLTYKRRLWHRLLQPRTLAHSAKKIIAVSETTKNDLVTMYNVQPEKITVVHSGVAQKPRADAEEIARVRATYDLPRRFILIFGTHEPRKNIAGVLAAYARYVRDVKDPVDLVVAGSRGWLEKDLALTAAVTALGDRVNSIGFVAEEDKAALYAASGATLFLSFYEGFGFPPLEAMQQGVPTITASVSALPEVLGSATLLIDPSDVAAMAHAMHTITSNTALRERLVARGLATAARYNWQEAATQTLHVFTQALA